YGNTALAGEGGGILSGYGSLKVVNSILTGDTGGECLAFPGSGVCPVNGASGNVVVPTPTQPILAPLGWYGGSTQTMIPLPGSEAICAGLAADDGGITSDQRGFQLDVSCGSNVDAGAVQTNYLIVTTTDDTNDATPGC